MPWSNGRRCVSAAAIGVSARRRDPVFSVLRWSAETERNIAMGGREQHCAAKTDDAGGRKRRRSRSTNGPPKEAARTQCVPRDQRGDVPPVSVSPRATDRGAQRSVPALGQSCPEAHVVQSWAG